MNNKHYEGLELIAIEATIFVVIFHTFSNPQK